MSSNLCGWCACAFLGGHRRGCGGGSKGVGQPRWAGGCRRSLLEGPLNSVSHITSMSLEEANAASADVNVQAARSVAEIERLRAEWTAWHCHPNSDIDYFLANLQTTPGTLSPHVISVYRDSVLDCLLVGKLQQGLSPVSSLGISLPPARVLFFVTEGFLGNQSTENAELVVREVLHCLGQGLADAAEFNDLPEYSPLYRAVKGIPGIRCRDGSPVARTHRRLVLPATFHEYFRGLSSKERSNFRAHGKLLLNSFPGKVRVDRFCEHQVDILIRDVETVAAKSYQCALGTGFTVADASALRLDAQNSALRAYVLYVESEPCAFLLATWYKGTLYGRSIGYVPKYRRFAPGQYLLMRFIEDCFRPVAGQPTIAIDPGPGAHQYKRSFTNHETREYSIVIYAPTAKGALLNVARTLVLFGARAGKALLAKTGLTDKVWKIWKTWRERSTSSGRASREQSKAAGTGS